MNEKLFLEAATLPDSPEKTAALAAWVQGLAGPSAEAPILVGGAAVELYTGGAYRTGDLDFVGVPGTRIEAGLEAVGFKRRGRHWIHDEHKIFLEFPSSSLDQEETAATIRVDKYSVLVVGLEELIVDRLAAWQFWGSEVDAVNSLLLEQSRTDDLDLARLRTLATTKKVNLALTRLEEFVEMIGEREPTTAEVEDWSRHDFKARI